MQAPERPITWRCGHRYPSVVDTTKEGGKRARCLGCGTIGPSRADAAGAMRALRDHGRTAKQVVEA